MDLKSEVRKIMRESETGLTVNEVVEEVAGSLKDEIKSILNTLEKEEFLSSISGTGNGNNNKIYLFLDPSQ